MHDSPLRFAAPIGRLLFALIFVLSAAGKFADWQGTVQMMTDKGLPSVEILLSIAVALEVIGGVSVIIGLYARLGAFALLAFLIPVSVIMHNFWTLEGADRMNQMINFMKNVSMMGGAILIMALGAGPISIDALLSRTSARPPGRSPFPETPFPGIPRE